MHQRTFRLGKIDIYFPDSVIKKYWFYADVAALLNQETTEQAVSLIRKELKQRGFGRIAFDSEADGTSVSYRDGQKVFEVAAVINELHNPSFMVSQELRDSFKEEIANYKIPKGQNYKIGDKIIVPDSHNTYFHIMQMIDEYEGSAVCILFNKVYKGMDEAASAEIGKDLLKEHVFAAMCLQESYIIDYTFKVISSNHEPLARVLYTNRRNRLLDETFPNISIQELFELERNAANSDFMKESRQKLSYLTWIN
ncbi:hypothetical protein P9G44_05700 [Bacillus paralicheniformis]|uniref:hypothetical protein n=1 Tax=Bacillus TaxID=1386 RepID=UPI0011A679E9|nr:MULTISPECIES: hypothetical protein [Bacillus]KAA0835492.1 hypothetical protein EI979_18725 [Bacillus paralicheniformis]KAA0842536.1 hypothetical protein EI977_04990 [Bacillus paralicheniformis]MCD2367175.1 hypothetical protein [Bacillus sp. BS3(2021)]MCJ8228568.1 hypothetical protein [Bacillus paralicheniformis]MEC2210208.1 hypothetical protein [Bacillus paralicheniformis]